MELKVAFLGPEGTYTHQAVIQHFGNFLKKVKMFPQKSISDCFKAIYLGEVDYSVVPYENSTNGQVCFTYDLIRDLFLQSNKYGKAEILDTCELTKGVPNFKIVAEELVPIHHNFLSKANSFSEIKTIYTHPQVWTQISLFMRAKIPHNVSKIDTTSTSKAAEIVSQDETNTTACISSDMSAILYNLPVHFKNIEDNPDNTTRFLIWGYDDYNAVKPYEDLKHGRESYITSIIFSLNDNDPGALCTALYSLNRYNINLGSINSRPNNRKKWHYVFFIEIMGNPDIDDNVKNGITSLKENSLELVVLGIFKRNRAHGSS